MERAFWHRPVEAVRPLWARFSGTIVSWFRPHRTIPQPELAPAPEPIDEPRPRRARREPPADNTWDRTFGKRVTLAGLLDDLDACCAALRQLRRADPDTFDLYSKVGARVMDPEGWFTVAELEPAFRELRPSTGMVHVCSPKDDADGRVGPRFVYFVKRDKPALVQPFAGDVYELTIYWATEGDTRGALGVCYVGISADGTTVVPLRERLSYKNDAGVPIRGWGLPPFLAYLAQNRAHREEGSTPADVAIQTFLLAANATVLGEDGFQVRATKNGTTAMFNIDMIRAPYFFRDRDKTINQNGQTRRIFHIVRTHRRVTGRFVRTHFRGEREFKWNGYDVHVTVSGLHHASLNLFRAPTHIGKASRKTLTMHEAGVMIAESMEHCRRRLQSIRSFTMH